jgi:flagellar basal-body rod protein FlgF
MDRLVYVAMTGAREAQLAQAVTANNLANASTTGFRATLAGASHVALAGPGHAEARAYAVTEPFGIDLEPGALVTTGRDLDVAIDGSGWMVVLAPDGSEALSRAGDLRVDSQGLVTNGAGQPVLGSGGPILLPPYSTLEIGSDGAISVRAQGQEASSLAQVDRIRLVDPPPADLVRGEDGLIRVAPGAPAPPEVPVQLRSGMLEGSNVNAVHAMVEMIQQARSFELQVRMMTTAKDNDQASADLLRLS